MHLAIPPEILVEKYFVWDSLFNAAFKVRPIAVGEIWRSPTVVFVLFFFPPKQLLHYYYK